MCRLDWVNKHGAYPPMPDLLLLRYSSFPYMCAIIMITIHPSFLHFLLLGDPAPTDPSFRVLVGLHFNLWLGTTPKVGLKFVIVKLCVGKLPNLDRALCP